MIFPALKPLGHAPLHINSFKSLEHTTFTNISEHYLHANFRPTRKQNNRALRAVSNFAEMVN